MTDYWAIMLQGLFTGMGVILAHKIWATIEKYQNKIKKGLTQNNKEKIKIFDINELIKK